MKILNNKYLLLSMSLLVFTACIEDQEDAVPYSEQFVEVTSGTADFSNMVALGATVTAGYTDGALFYEGQKNSFANIMSGVMSQAIENQSSNTFSQPYTDDNIGGLLIGGQPYNGSRLFFNGAGPASLPGTTTTDALNVQAGPYSNMAAPGVNAVHMLAPGYGSFAGLQVGQANPYYVRMASSQGASILGDAIAQAPSFVSLWSGFSDALAYATDGGTNVPLPDLTSAQGFGFAFGTTAGSLNAYVANGVVINVPDVTNNPFFNTIPWNAIPLDPATAGGLSAAFAPYNGGLDASVGLYAATGGAYGISQAEADLRYILVEAGPANPILINDEELTVIDLTPFGGPVLPNLRHTNSSDKILLSTSSILGTQADPNNPTLVWGVSVPLDDTRVLTGSEISALQTAIAGMNSTIDALAPAGWARFDAHSFFNEVVEQGVQFDDYVMTGDLVFGGFFSLDGIHPTARGNALLANKVMEAIDATYGSNLSEAAAVAGEFPTNYSPTMN